MAREITIIAVAGFELQALHYYELIPGTAVFEGIMYTWYQVLLLLYTLRGQECGPYQPSMNTITGDHIKQDLTYREHKNLYISLFLPTIFGLIYYVWSSAILFMLLFNTTTAVLLPRPPWARSSRQQVRVGLWLMTHHSWRRFLLLFLLPSDNVQHELQHCYSDHSSSLSWKKKKTSGTNDSYHYCLLLAAVWTLLFSSVIPQPSNRRCRSLHLKFSVVRHFTLKALWNSNEDQVKPFGNAIVLTY